MLANSLLGFTIFVVCACFIVLNALYRCVVVIYDWYVYVLLGNFGNNLIVS